MSSTRFADLPLHPAVAAALARKGYDVPTPVQAAVLGAEVAGRDLLVSSQTGSGKTVAFGALLAAGLLDGAAPRRGRRRPPRALVVAPTRELAAQVRRELEWLLEETGLTLGSFTGGTEVRGDLRALQDGVDVVVGTPGRLVDLHRRGALDLSLVAVLVIDEADEMLDLGFKEDLEYLLASAPAGRRTLLFSATIPRDIERLAATYQRDAARLDVRPAGAARGHADITQVAHLVRASDRFAALVNVLLAAGDAKAIVFCRTREAVGAVHQRLVDHGFRVVSMAGDRAQSERDRALEALRAGRARVLVATNVAARGLDLPDVDRVIHADLPDDAESLTHRSGRTGRAGRKGVSVVIAEERARRKAERLFAQAGLAVAWTPPPTEAEVRERQHEELIERLVEEARSAGHAQDDSAEDLGIAHLADRLRAAIPDRVLVSLLAARELARLPRPLSIAPVSIEPPPRKPRAEQKTWSAGRPGARREGPPAAIFRINLGAEAQADPGSLLPVICRRGGITRHAIGKIRIGPRSSTFEIAPEAADAFARAVRRPDPGAPDVRIEPVHGGKPPPRHDGRAARPRRSPR